MTSSTPLWFGLDRILRPIENIAALLGAAMMLIAMVLVSADALMRYAFNAPLTFQYTLTEQYLMVALVCLPLAWGFRTGGYIRIEGLIDRLPQALREKVLRAGLITSAVYVAALAWTAGGHFWKAYTTGEVMFGVIDWPVAWSWVWVPVGCWLLAARLLLMSFGPRTQLEADPHAGEHVE
ncbi:TRAP transporter small permease [Paracoccus sp. (in: a-proteobacteria)]|uniref:TRAP transporter small permease n=1 Tax=Paracoccus sp. TaxID=267 RepID=UPI002AFF0009|nr:TRAP transporter small permease [Paracoccus sp. (in: a-proteobacteria)]